MEKVRSDFNLLKHNPDKKGFLDRCEELSQRKADVQRIWQEIDDALEVPWIPIGVRKDLLTRDRAISSSFNRTPPKNERTPTAPEQEQLARKFARRQGELTMAVMGDSSADKRIDPKFGESADWWQIAARDSDEKVGDGWQKKAQQLVDLVAKKNRAAVPDELDRTYIQADRLARIIDGTAKVDPRTAPDPGVTKRRLDLHRFFCWQAERSYKDHWYDRDDNNKIDGEKYYMKAVKSLLNDAESFVLAEQTDLSDGDKNLRRTLVDAERTQLVPYGIQVVRSDSKSKDPRVTWTTEAVLKLEYLWKVVDDKDAAFKEPLNGFPVFWRATDKPLPEPADYRQVKVQRSLEKKTEAPDEIELRHPGPDVKGSGQVTYTAMFRGQVLTPSTFVDLQTRPDVVVYQHKVPLGGALAARSNLTTHLSIIIDFSGSMKQNLKDGKQKKAAALNALNSLLPALSRNDGVRVSIRTFGPANTKLCTAEKWTKEKKDEILEKVRGLEKLDPAGDTPLVRNLKDAYDEMLKTGDDANIILVLTDGVDEIYDPIKKDSVKTPSKDVKKQVQEFLKPGVMLNMVLLNLDKDDDALAKDSFDWIEKTTPETGTLFRASTTGELDEKLNAAMQDAIYPKLRLYIESGLRLPEDIYGKEIGKSKGGYTIARMEDTQLYWTHLLKVHPLDGYPPPFTKESLQQLKLKDGERLILNLERQGRKVVFKRGLFVEEEQRKSLDKKNAEKSKNWWLAEHYNRLQGKELHLFVTLENFTDLVNPNGPLEQIKPGFVWFEVSATNVDGQPDAKNIPLPIEIGNVTEYPAPAWYLHVRNWPGGKAKPVIRAWVTRDEPDAKSRIVTVGDLAGGARVKKTINVGGLDIDMYISLKKNQDVSLSYDGVKGPAVSAKRDCLVVQLDHPLNKRFIARQSGLKEEGHEHQMFFTKEGGQYTAKFWLDPSDELRANKDITIQVFPLEEFQSKAEKIELQLVNSPNGTNEPPEPPKPAK